MTDPLRAAFERPEARDGIDWLFGPQREDDPEEPEDEEPEELEVTLLAVADETEEESSLFADFEFVDESIPGRDVERTPVDERDEAIEQYAGDAPHATVQSRVREAEVVEDLTDALEGLSVEEHETTATEGDLLDMRNVTRRLAGDTTMDEYYRRPTQLPADDLAVGVSIDMSGSMRKYEEEAKAAFGAFLYTVDQLDGTVVANGWKHQGKTKIQMVTAPGERFRWRHLDAIEPGGGDPIARGMRECGDLLRRTQADERILFVISDGKPTVDSLPDHDFDSPLDEAAHVADQELRPRGVTVIGVGFGGVNEENLIEMFGEEFAVHVDLEDLADELADVLLEHVGSGPQEVAL